MLDHHNRVRALVTQTANDLRDLLRLLRIHASRRLVEEQNIRPRGHGPRNFQPSPIGIRQRIGGLIEPVSLQPRSKEAQCVEYSLLVLALLTTGAGGSKHDVEEGGVRPAIHGSRDVLADGEVLEQPHVLECSGHPAPRDLVRVDAPDRLAEEQDVTLVRRVDPGDHVEEGGLSCPIRADHAQDL